MVMAGENIVTDRIFHSIVNAIVDYHIKRMYADVLNLDDFLQWYFQDYVSDETKF